MPNIQVDMSREGEHNLVEKGFVKDPKGGPNNITLYTKDNIQYTVRDNATSTGGTSVDYGPTGARATLKIRLTG